MQIAVADRQAVFKGDCARCHADPGSGKQGRGLYLSVCGVCHEAEHRASMVPNLRALPHPTDADHWSNWIRHGKAGTLMPAFSPTEGGPLSEEQITSLVKYLTENIPSRPAVAPSAPSALPTP
jgi:mono/diheme cytochrome c family protein